MKYSELTRLDDIALARAGWRRNDQGGLSRLRPGDEAHAQAGKRTWGIVGFVRGMVSGAAPATTAAARLHICRACQAADSAGQRLYRRDGEKEYCGRPRLQKVLRDEARDGCGCELRLKTSKAEAACPLGRWKAMSESDAPPMALYDPAEPPPAVSPPQPSLDGAIVVGMSKPCGCGKSVSNKQQLDVSGGPLTGGTTMTESEARAAAIADGILESQITPQILAYYGYVVPSPTAGLQVGAVVIPSELKADLEAIEAARKANQIPQQILGAVTGWLGWAKTNGILALSALLVVFLVAGCGDTTAVRRGVEQLDRSVKALNEQHLAFEDRFVKEFEEKETAKILALDAAARGSSTVTVTTMEERVEKVPVKAADGSDAYKEEKRMVSVQTRMIPANVAEALDKQKARLFTQMSNTVSFMRTQQARICENAANAAAYIEGLKSYFEQRQATYEAMLAAQTSFQGWLETLLVKKPVASPEPAK